MSDGFVWTWQLFVFGYSARSFNEFGDTKSYCAPYSFFALPLIAFSAWLLLPAISVQQHKRIGMLVAVLDGISIFCWGLSAFSLGVIDLRPVQNCFGTRDGCIDAVDAVGADGHSFKLMKFKQVLMVDPKEISQQRQVDQSGLPPLLSEPGFELDEHVAPLPVASIPFWLIVLPLTVLSAWLLLSKRNHSDSTKSPPQTFNMP